jgi:diguanylate cyclase (GGDEF)-like protein
VGWVRQWWEQPDHFRWLSGYLGYRNLRGFTRRMMAVVVIAFGAAPALTMWTPIRPTTPVHWAIGIIVAVCCVAMAAMWLIGWPTRRQSVFFVLLADASVALACLNCPSPYMSLLGCTAFAALAGYVAFFHTSRYLAVILATATATSIICAVRLAATDGVVIAVASLLIIAVGVLAVPFSVHVLVHLLGDDALKSHTDPLTGLRNRRGFSRSARDLLRGSSDGAAPYLSLIMLDLDRFKEVNDTRGHPTGDRILVAVADTLRHATGGRAVVARVGGEEFVVAAMTHRGEAAAIAERLREAVAAIPRGTTASVGVASITRSSKLDARDVIAQLIDAADSAMYMAKRAGGNQIRHADRTAIHS